MSNNNIKSAYRIKTIEDNQKGEEVKINEVRQPKITLTTFAIVSLQVVGGTADAFSDFSLSYNYKKLAFLRRQ